MNDNHTPTVRQRILGVLSIPTAVAAFTYVTCGRGFVWDPWAYTAAWLTLIAALAYGIPMLDVTIDTLIALATTIARHIIYAARHAHDWLAALADRRHATPARVVRSTTHMGAGR